MADELELEELGSQVDDPELLVMLEGGMDDPDGIDRSAGIPRQRMVGDGTSTLHSWPAEADEGRTRR